MRSCAASRLRSSDRSRQVSAWSRSAIRLATDSSPGSGEAPARSPRRSARPLPSPRSTSARSAARRLSTVVCNSCVCSWVRPMPPRSQGACLSAEATPRVEARRIAQLLEQLLLAFRKGGRDGDAEHGVEIARAAAGPRQPFARKTQLLAGLGAGRHLEGDTPLHGGNLDLRAEGGLPRRERHVEVEVVPAHPE